MLMGLLMGYGAGGIQLRWICYLREGIWSGCSWLGLILGTYPKSYIDRGHYTTVIQ
jgi:hypothetical protein